jgi:predicted N-acetyltransferase YhbS
MEVSAISCLGGGEDATELLGLFDRVFSPEDTRLWQMFHGRPPFYRPEWSRVIRRGDRIASHVCWVPRGMRVGQVPVRAGAIGYVATDPEFRGQGLAAALMRGWTAELTRRGEHLSFVTGIPDFYEPFGYTFAFPLDDVDVRRVAEALAVRSIAGKGGSALPPTLWAPLRRLFPKDCPYIWRTDSGY